MQGLIPRHPLGWWQQALVALGTTSAAWLARLGLAPMLLDQSPYPLFLVSVLVTGLLCDWGISIIATVAGGVIANIEFAPPYGHLALSGKFGWAFALYFATAMAIVWLGQSSTQTLRRESALSEHLRTVGDEYRHRIKNLLAMAQALIGQTARHAVSIADFQEKIMSRFQALSRTQDMLSNPSEVSVPLRRLVDEVVGPFVVEGRMAWLSRGPEASIPSDKAIALALILNELATNAVKYGALSVPTGRVSLDWAIEDTMLLIEWRESDGPVVSAPKKRGFGSRLFDQALPKASGKTKLSFDPDGLRCEIHLALHGL